MIILTGSFSREELSGAEKSNQRVQPLPSDDYLDEYKPIEYTAVCETIVTLPYVHDFQPYPTSVMEANRLLNY